MRTILTYLFILSVFSSFAQVTPICAIQGNGFSSPLVGNTINTTGIVTAVFNNPDQLDGFFMQAPQCDADPLTSNGIFVYDPGGTPVNVGDSIDLTANVSEFFGLTEIDNVSNLTIHSTGHVVSDVQIVLPFISDAELEALEGMFVSFPQTLVVTDHFNWARFGELILSANTRLVQPSNLVDPNDADPAGTTDSGNSNVNSLLNLQESNDRNRILVDDASSVQYSDPPPFINAQGTMRAGTEFSGLFGVLSYGFGDYRLMPTSVASISENARPSPPFEGTSDIQVVSFNVLNYWTTIGGWGAQTSAEFNRQQSKLANALLELDADVFGLMELENNKAEAYDDLLEALNEEAGTGAYAALDAINPGVYPTKSVMFYKTSTVTPIGPLRSLNDPIFERPTLSQIFEVNDGGGRFNYVLNHLRFKGCAGATGLDLDQGDGQACFNETRRQQAFAVLNFIDTIKLSTGLDQILIGGDFNAYTQEDPMDIIEGGGYNRLLSLDAYSFSFFGQWGALDHAFASDELLPAIIGSDIWHVNSDEPRGLGWEDVSSYLYQSGAYRSSDHDPVCVTLDKTMLTTSIEQVAERFEFKTFPNPFETSVNFEFELKENAYVKMEIFDAMGKRLAIPVNGNKTHGKQMLTWNSSALTGQFFLYKLTISSAEGESKIISGKLQKH